MKSLEEFLRDDSERRPDAAMKAGRVKMKRGAFTGWRPVRRQRDAFVVPAWHGLGTEFCTLEYWFRPDLTSGPEFFRRWSGKMAHPDEAGPSAIWTTSNWIYFHFEGNNPIFADFNGENGEVRFLDRGYIGAYVRPIEFAKKKTRKADRRR